MQHDPDNVSQWFRDWRKQRAADRSELRERIRQHVAAGGTVMERCFGHSTAWNLRYAGWIPAARTPERIAEHLAARAAGFGASHRFISKAGRYV